jgi:hypothetical protein
MNDFSSRRFRAHRKAKSTSSTRSLRSAGPILAAVLETLESRVMLTWIGATSGSTNDAAHDYNNTANWAGGVIDDSFSGVNFGVGAVLYLSANRTTGSSGLNLSYTGGGTLTFASSDPSTPRTFTFGSQCVSLGTMYVDGPRVINRSRPELTQ